MINIARGCLALSSPASDFEPCPSSHTIISAEIHTYLGFMFMSRGFKDYALLAAARLPGKHLTLRYTRVTSPLIASVSTYVLLDLGDEMCNNS